MGLADGAAGAAEPAGKREASLEGGLEGADDVRSELDLQDGDG